MKEGLCFRGKMGLNGQYSQVHIHEEPGTIKFRTGTKI